MRKIKLLTAIAGAAISFSSCGINSALVANHNLNATQVQLSAANFRVIDKVTGTSDVFYVFGIGDLNKKRLYENAYSAMMDKADLKGNARAVINVVSEEHVWGVVPFYFKRTITVSGNVVEFTR